MTRLDHTTLAVMQPYIFPYLGYFQLIGACDTFVFYDDVSFIKGGWINRNRILASNGNTQTFTIPLDGGQSSSRTIADTPLSVKRSWQSKFERSLSQTYARAPYLTSVLGLVRTVLDTPAHSIADLACQSVEVVCDHIGLVRKFERSSLFAPDTHTLDRTERLISLAHTLGATQYLNMEGGRKLYQPPPFEQAGLQLRFLKPHLEPYIQSGAGPFVPELSILDALMFNAPESVREMTLKGVIAA